MILLVAFNGDVLVCKVPLVHSTACGQNGGLIGGQQYITFRRFRMFSQAVKSQQRFILKPLFANVTLYTQFYQSEMLHYAKGKKGSHCSSHAYQKTSDMRTLFHIACTGTGMGLVAQETQVHVLSSGK